MILCGGRLSTQAEHDALYMLMGLGRIHEIIMLVRYKSECNVSETGHAALRLLLNTGKLGAPAPGAPL